jgi:hypothetical protein
MAPLPGPNQLGGPGSLRSGRIIASFDTTAIGRGLQQLGAGLADVGMVAKANQEREAAEIEAKRKELIQQNNVVDVGYAEAEWTKRDLARRQTFATDTDYSTFGKRYDEQTANDIKEIAATIRDPAMRDRFTALKTQDLVTSRASILALGEQKRIAAEKARGYDTLDTMRNVFVDPNTDEATRARTRDAIKAQIDLNEQTGIFSPEEARQARKLNIEDANLTFAKLWADANPDAIRAAPAASPSRTITDPQSAVDASPGDPIRQTVDRIIGVESGGRATAKNPRSSASGLGQFTNGTWLATVRKHRPDLAAQSDAALLGMKTDPALGREMTEALTRDNFAALASEGMPTTPGALYLAHFAGVDGAKRVFRASDETPIVQVLGPSAVKANPFLRGQNIGWLKRWSDRKMGGAPTGGATSAPANPPNYDNLTPEQKYNYAEFLDAKQRELEAADRERRIEARIGLESVITNAPAAIQNTGRYDQPLPTVEQFVDAYGEEGFAKHEEFTAAVETSRDVFDMRTMSKDEIERTVADATPVSTGNDAALETKRYDALSNAASAILKARDADPVGYVMQTVPAVRQAWEGVQPGTDGFSAAVQATTAAQMALGIDPAKIQPLPKEMAGTAATMFGNVELPEGDRIGALTSAVFSTPDPEQRRAIFKQLVAAGVPEHVEGALDAMERGDTAAATRLLRAATIDPTKIRLPNGVKDAAVTAALTDAMFKGAGDPTSETFSGTSDPAAFIYYGLYQPTEANTAKMLRDQALADRALKMRLMSGEPLETAAAAVVKDIIGDVQPFTGGIHAETGDYINAEILIPTGTDPLPALNLMKAYKRDVYMALSSLPQDILGTLPTADGRRPLLTDAVQERIDNIVSEGYFVERNGGWVFIDPYTDRAIAGPDGAPLVFDTTGYRSLYPTPAGAADEAKGRSPILSERIQAENPFNAADEPTITVTPGRQRADTTGRAAGNMAERSVTVEQPADAQPPQAPAAPPAPGTPGWQERTMQTLQGGGIPSPSDMTPSVGDVTGEALRRLLGGN